MDEIQAIQGDQYAFPYHYLPQPTRNGFRSFRSWNWSLSYVTALRLLSEELERRSPASVIDVGCGDGALVHHIRRAMPQVRVVGVDYDERPIAFARLFTPSAEFISGDIGAMTWDAPFDVATLVEVIEHIPPADVAGFMASVRRVVADDGRLIVTVPHVNKPVADKHYRHFSFESLTEALSPQFEIETMFGFEKIGGWKDKLVSLTDNRHWFAEVPRLNRMLLQSELRFRTADEQGCGRIFAVARPRSPT